MKIRMLPCSSPRRSPPAAAQAADKTPPRAARGADAQQQAARAEIDRLVKRIEELSKQLGEGTTCA
jgi:hypothetical protein